MARPRVLYLSYDGILEPLGASQILSYLQRLAADFSFTVVSFEKPDDCADERRMSTERGRLDQFAIEWVPLKYHKRPPVLSTAYDLVSGIRCATRLARSKPFEIVHARSYVPSVIAMAVARRTGAKFVFDMRGFWVDEKVEAGAWTKRSLVYRVGKWYERRFLNRANAIVSLTEEGVSSLTALGFRPERNIPIEVIPTCVDLERFARRPKDSALCAQLGLGDQLVVGSIGTLSNRYLRLETLKYFAWITEAIDGLKILLVTRDDHAALRRDAAAAGLAPERLILASADFSQMPSFVRLIDVGVFFMKPVFAQKGSAATKMAELLASGVPVVVNDGVADSSAIVRNERVGVVLPEPTRAAFEASLPAVRALFRNEAVAKRCREAAVKLFDVEAGSARYAKLYRALLAAKM